MVRSGSRRRRTSEEVDSETTSSKKKKIKIKKSADKSTKKDEDKTTEDGDSGDSEEDGGTTLKSKVTEVPIDNYEEAMDFAKREWNKIKRENGHTLECEVQGSCNWEVGEWCKVYLPSFDIDDYMYVIRVSQSSEGGEWSSNLSLMDYPPGWGKEEIKKDEEENSEEEGEEGDGTGDGTGDGSDSDGGTGDGTGDGSSNSNTGDGTTDVGGMQLYES